jgi:hypothetical protein
MTAGLPPDDAYAPYLREIAGLSVTLARELHNRAIESEDNDQCARLASAFHKVTRGLRQTLALAAKLEQDYVRAEREAQPERDRRHKAKVAERHTKLHRVMQKTIWDEAESPDHAEDLIEFLFDVLKEEAESESFLDEPIETQIDRIRLTLDLPVATEEAVAEAVTPDAMAKAQLPPFVRWVEPPKHLKPNTS